MEAGGRTWQIPDVAGGMSKVLFLKSSFVKAKNYKPKMAYCKLGKTSDMLAATLLHAQKCHFRFPP